MKLRQMFRVSWNGGEPVSVITNARDIAAIDEATEEPHAIMTYRVVYSALCRYKLDVPDFDAWVDQLDEFERVREGADEGSPTKPAASTNGQLPSRSQPEPTPTTGSKIIEPYSPQNA